MNALLKEIRHDRILWLLAFVPVVLATEHLEPEAHTLLFLPGAVVMMPVATMTASLVTTSGRSMWFVGVLLLMVYAIFAMTLYLLPPRV